MSKSKKLRAALCGKRIALAVTAAFLPWDAVNAQTTPPPNTLPTNGAFAAGIGTIQTPTAGNYLRVDQSSTKGIINWDTFSIGSAAHVHFNHEAGRAGMTLNRVVGNEASQIFVLQIRRRPHRRCQDPIGRSTFILVEPRPRDGHRRIVHGLLLFVRHTRLSIIGRLGIGGHAF